MKIWQVYYSNYFPREVDSTWATEAQAEKRAAELKGPWNVEAVEVGGSENPDSAKEGE